jgi:hypothetical protein
MEFIGLFEFRIRRRLVRYAPALGAWSGILCVAVRGDCAFWVADTSVHPGGKTPLQLICGRLDALGLASSGLPLQGRFDRLDLGIAEFIAVSLRAPSHTSASS